ncbi:Cysteine-rich protein 2-binding protein [Hypsizygus marmoreus]|uniref:Cysteine-rich protein 2-binding protein n=1 Tax=Hypsizygus marmoreus TaxID=39966 RepID=A0A369J563_HYPMA|nr:Cysteine-rich protein 2-binding protein [Hypsizygus marmoreus]
MGSGSGTDSDEYQDDEKRQPKRSTRTKRRKVQSGRAVPVGTIFDPSTPLAVFDELGNGDPTITSFQDIMDHFLPNFLESRATLQESKIEKDEHGQDVRPLTRSEVSSFINAITSQGIPMTVSEVITARKLKLNREKRRANIPETKIEASSTVNPLPPPVTSIPPHPEVVAALYNIQTTPFESSFLSRLQGTRAPVAPFTAIAIDWETITPWMSLMTDIRDHYILSHPERDPPVETMAPITYTYLQRSHLDQIHNLLERMFWAGIDVTDSLDHSPERCTVVATYKRLVVGVAILSSPRETYITYLAVRAGWDNARIARSMLYHLIMLNPNKDITLHVSVNNSAMLLYNQFGFKAEEFVAGFYEDYLDPQSRASKNAFRLRLRQQ